MHYTCTITAAIALASLPACVESRHHVAEEATPDTAEGFSPPEVDLSSAPSPFDRSFADSAVWWRPWGDEAFAAAEEADLPVFLFIGYPSCPWCSEMRRVSFDDPAIAQLINQNFIPVIADADSLPGVNRVFMRYLEAVRGQSGWPLCVWLTPDRLPITGGNYFSATADGQGPAFTAVLNHVAGQWKRFREHYKTQTRRDLGELVERLAELDAQSDWIPSHDIVEETYTSLASAFDPVSGGFGSAPKFPAPLKLDFLLAFASSLPDNAYQKSRALSMVTETLDHLSASATHDHLAGGFFRYSQHPAWNSPNFEKMLDDQALIATAYMHASAATGEERHAATARRTLEFVTRKLALPGGGYASAIAGEPAQPSPTTTFGAYYTWTPDEIASALEGSPDLIATATSYYNISSRGNFLPGSTSHDGLARRNTLHTDELATAPPPDIAQINDALLAAREKRTPPYTDPKIILEWNALLVSAFVLASDTFDDPAYLDRATALANYLFDNFIDPDTNQLVRTLFAGQRGAPASSGDLAALVAACIDLHHAAPSGGWLDRALALQKQLDDRFLDPEIGGYWDVADRNTHFYNLKPTLDGTRPSANSHAAQNFVDLAVAAGDSTFLDRARALFAARHATFGKAPSLSPAMLIAVAAYLDASTASP